MTKEEVLKYDIIYAAMYGSNDPQFNCIVGIPIFDLKFCKDNSGFIYIWGWPGPDYNYYKYSDYGITWFFTVEEAHKAGFKTWEEEHKK